MKKMRVFYLVVVFALLVVSVVMFSGIARAGAVPEGFAGIPWGASRDQIIKTMNEKGYQQLTGLDPGDVVAFRGAFAGVPCELFFFLIANSFYRGEADHCAIDPYGVGPRYFEQQVVTMLSEKYGPPQRRESKKDEAHVTVRLTLEGARWECVDSRTSDKYNIAVYLYKGWMYDGTLNYYVNIKYEAESLGKRLQKKEY